MSISLVKWNIGGILLVTSLSIKALSPETFNNEYRREVFRHAELRSVRHRLPNPYVEDSLINLIQYSQDLVEDLWEIPDSLVFSSLSQSTLRTRNDVILDLIDQMGKEIKGQVSEAEARIVLERAYRHPVVGKAALDKYDPINSETNSRKYGYCFARADYVYFLLRTMNVDRSSILKLFLLGSIAGDFSFGKNWRYHVVTIVKKKGGDWLAIDPFFRFVGTPRDWFQKNAMLIKNGKSLLYLTPAERMFVQGGDHTYISIINSTFPKIQEWKYHWLSGFASRYEPLKNSELSRFFADFFKSILTEYGEKRDLICEIYEICGKKGHERFNLDL